MHILMFTKLQDPILFLLNNSLLNKRELNKTRNLLSKCW